MATGELATLVLADNSEGVKALYEEKNDLIDLNAEDIDYTENGVEKTLTKPLIVAAIEGGNIDIVKFLLEKGADVNKYYKGIHPPGPIFFVTEYLHPKPSEEMSLAVFQNANMNLKNAKGQTILFEAQTRNPDYASQVLKKFAVNIAERDCTGHTVVDEVLFHDMYQLMPVYQQYVVELIQANDVTTIKNLVLDGFEYVLQGGGVSALDVAQSSGAEDVASFIQEVPKLMDSIPTLHSATGQGNLDGVTALANKDLVIAKDSGGRCILHIAVMCEKHDIVKSILENYSETTHITDVYHRTPLHYAAALPNGSKLYDMLVNTGADENARDCYNLTPKDYLSEMTSPGSKNSDVDVVNMMEKERSAKYGIKIYLKLQYQAIMKAIEENNIPACEEIISNLAFPVEDFVTEGVSEIPLLFYCVEKGAEDIALFLLTKDADPTVTYKDQKLQDAAFKAQMQGLYLALANVLDFKARRMSAFSETSSMLSETIAMPKRAPPPEAKVPAGLNGFDSQYLGRVLGQTLTDAISEVAEKRPWDPIEYLAQWLYKYSRDQEKKAKEKEEEYQLELERAEAELQSVRKRRTKKEAKHLQKLDSIREKQLEEENKRKEEEEKKKKEMEELRNKQREMDQLAQAPDLDTVKEDDEPSAQQQVPAQQEEESTDNNSTEESQQPTEQNEQSEDA